ncbi:MAG: DUF6448 family protein [Candidatus Sulfotelmatobacter sp.]
MIERLGTFAILCSMIILGFGAPLASAHCDTLDGPVVTAARNALQSGDVTPVLKWVQKEYESEVRIAFTRALAVRRESAIAKELADTYFLETVVRLHRTGEGAPYTGLKPAGTELNPAVADADKALVTGSADELVRMLTSEVEKGIRQRFQQARQARKSADQSVESGREYVNTYVALIHYVEQLHGAAADEANTTHSH